MYEQIEKPRVYEAPNTVACVQRRAVKERQDFGFVDCRPEAVAQRKLQHLMGGSDCYSGFVIQRSQTGVRELSQSDKPIQMIWPGFSGIGSMLYSGATAVKAAAMAHPYISAGLALGSVAAMGAHYAYKNYGILKGPKEGQKGLEDLPTDQMWRMYINPKDHEKAEAAYAEDGRMSSPGDYYRFYDEKDRPKADGDISPAFEGE